MRPPLCALSRLPCFLVGDSHVLHVQWRGATPLRLSPFASLPFLHDLPPLSLRQLFTGCRFIQMEDIPSPVPAPGGIRVTVGPPSPPLAEWLAWDPSGERLAIGYRLPEAVWLTDKLFSSSRMLSCASHSSAHNARHRAHNERLSSPPCFGG